MSNERSSFSQRAERRRMDLLKGGIVGVVAEILHNAHSKVFVVDAASYAFGIVALFFAGKALVSKIRDKGEANGK